MIMNGDKETTDMVMTLSLRSKIDLVREYMMGETYSIEKDDEVFLIQVLLNLEPILS